MSKQITASFKDSTPEWDEQTIVEWFTQHRKTIIYSFVIALAMILVIYRLLSNRFDKSEVDFFQAQSYFTQFQTDSLDGKEETQGFDKLQRLKALMYKHPELKEKYAGSLAQLLLIDQKAQEAIPFAEDVFKRTHSDDMDLYQQYARISLILGKGDYKEALTEAKTLQERLQPTTSPYLYGFNLIRLAFLYQQLQLLNEEQQTWHELQQWLNTYSEGPVVEKVFTSGNLSLKDYIKQRL